MSNPSRNRGEQFVVFSHLAPFAGRELISNCYGASTHCLNNSTAHQEYGHHHERPNEDN